MDYIINPAWFYWMNVLDSIKIVAFIFLIISIVTSIILIMALYEYKSDLVIKKVLIKSIIIFFVCLILTIFIPDKQTMTEMLIAQCVTKSNMEYTEEEIKDLIDYTVEKVNEVKSK